MDPETPLRSRGQAGQPIQRSWTTPLPSSSAQTPSSQRKSPQSDEQKLLRILKALSDVNWNVPKFLAELFKASDLPGDSTRKRTVTSILNGSSKPYMASILDLIYERSLKVEFRTSDTSVKPGKNMFNPDIELHQIQHATPAMTTWAVRHVAMVVQGESDDIVDEKAGLHLRARAKEGGRFDANRISWEAIQHFSFKHLQEIAQRNSPSMSFLLNAYTNKDFLEGEAEGRVISIRHRRPQDLVAVTAHMALVFARSSRANLYPICRGIWMFATKAANTNFRVDSRIGLCVAHSTVYEALKEMARQKGVELKKAVEFGKHFIVVFDNIQAYIKQRDRRIGRENRIITGLAATAVEMEDYSPSAFDLKDLLTRQARQERKQLTTELILEDLDFTHLAKVAKVHFLQGLINFVPALAVYRKKMADLAKGLAKTQIPPTRKSNITPLATNSADEMHVQGMKQGVLDFLSTQMGITADNLNNMLSILSGDGKTYAMLLLLKKLLSPEGSDYESLRWIYALLELWHTKWTDLSRIVRAHWGSTDDPSSLASVAKISNCPTPSDLRKVDFFEGSHLVNLALDAHILVCWEVYFKTNDLTKHFELLSLQEPSQLPSFEELEKGAEVLSQRHATTQAYSRACFPSTTQPSLVPAGSQWTGPSSSEDISMNEISINVEDASASTAEDSSTTNELPLPRESKDGDLTLANSTLFIRNTIWWREVCVAVAEGDPGRVWEIMKLWIFTFAGSGNPHYSNFLLELYCSFKWECKPELREAILKNWLVNRTGEPGHFLEMDLLQEHSNFWLEDLAQHKGKEFDEPFYRQIISPNVIEFLGLKDEMEETVSLKRRSKKHGATGVDNELQAIMKQFRSAEVECFRKGRAYGKVDHSEDFTRGFEALNKNKIKDFLTKSSIFSNVLRMHTDTSSPTELPAEGELGETSDLLDQSDELQDDNIHHPRMVMVDGMLCTTTHLEEGQS